MQLVSVRIAPDFNNGEVVWQAGFLQDDIRHNTCIPLARRTLCKEESSGIRFRSRPVGIGNDVHMADDRDCLARDTCLRTSHGRQRR